MGVVLVDSSEFNRLIEKYIDVVFRSALSFCQNKSDAEDVTQNTFIKLLKSETAFESDEHISPLAFGLAQKGRFVQRSGC